MSVEAARTIQRWQDQRFQGDYDKYYLIMQKKFRKLYPYSIYVLNKSALIIQHAFFNKKAQQQRKYASDYAAFKTYQQNGRSSRKGEEIQQQVDAQVYSSERSNTFDGGAHSLIHQSYSPISQNQRSNTMKQVLHHSDTHQNPYLKKKTSWLKLYMEREQKKESDQKIEKKLKKLNKDFVDSHRKINDGWTMYELTEILKNQQISQGLRQDKSDDQRAKVKLSKDQDFSIDYQMLHKLQNEQLQRRKSLRAGGLQLSSTPSKSQVVLKDYSKVKPSKKSNISGYHSSQSKGSNKNIKLRNPGAGGAFKATYKSRSPMARQNRDYTPTKSQTILKQTFASQMKQRDKSQKHFETISEVFNSAKYQNPFRQNRLNAKNSNGKSKSILNELEDKIIHMLEKNDQPQKPSTEFLLHKASLIMNKTQQSPISRVIQEFHPHHHYQFDLTQQQQQQWNYDSPEIRGQNMNKADRQILNRIEQEFSFQNGSSAERSNSKDRKQQLVYQKSNNSTSPLYENNNESPVKIIQPHRRTRAQRLKKPDPNGHTYLGGSSSQKRATDIVLNSSPRVDELKKRSSSRASKSSRHSKHPSTGRDHYVRAPSSTMQLNDEDIEISHAKQFQSRQLQNIIRDTDFNDFESESLTSHEERMDALMAKHTVSQKGIAKPQDTKVRSSNLSRLTQESPRRNDQRSDYSQSKLSPSKMAQLQEEEVYISKFNQEVNQLMQRQQQQKAQQQQQQKGIPSLKFNNLYAN